MTSEHPVEVTRRTRPLEHPAEVTRRTRPLVGLIQLLRYILLYNCKNSKKIYTFHNT